jgi:hypothetical protein
MSHDAHDLIGEEKLYSSHDPIMIHKKIIKANKECCLLYLEDQTPKVKQRIKLVMTQLRTYKVITII